LVSYAIGIGVVLPAAPHGAKHVGFVQRPQFVQASFLNGADQRVAGVIEHDIEPAEVRMGLRYGRLHLRRLGYVQLQRQHASPVGGSQVGDAGELAGRGDYLIAALQGGLRPDAAKAPGSARNKPDFGAGISGDGWLRCHTV
jgi:hypothetical protein